MSQATEPDKNDAVELKNVIKASKNDQFDLGFILLNMPTTDFASINDAGFATNNDLSPLLDYVNILIDFSKNCDVVPFSCDKSSRVVNDIFVAELLVTTHCTAVASIIFCETFLDIFRGIISTKFYMNAKDFFNS